MDRGLNKKKKLSLMVKYVKSKSLFGYDGSVPFGDRFHCKRVFRFETEGNRPFVWGNGTEPL